MNREDCVVVCRDNDDYHQMCIDLDVDGIVWASKNKLCWFEDGKYVFYYQNICGTHSYRVVSGLLYKETVRKHDDIVINASDIAHGCKITADGLEELL